MIRRVRFAIVALLILGVLATGAFLGWSTTPTRTVVPAIELRAAAPLDDTTTQLADPDARPKARSTSRPRKAAASRTANRPQAPRPVSNLQAEPETESLSTPEPVASTQTPRETPAAGNAPRGGDADGGGGNGNGNDQTPPTTNPAPQSPTVGAAVAPAAPPAPAGGEDDDAEDDDDDEGGDDDGDDGGDDG
jgi:hypothetical protein